MRSTAGSKGICALIDFEGISPGSTVAVLSSGSGISGAPVAGFITVSGLNPLVGGNAAMIYDSLCASGCTGEDWDLEAPALGTTLIVSEDLDGSDPDDLAGKLGQTLTFDFTHFGPGAYLSTATGAGIGGLGHVRIASIEVLDVEATEAGGGAILMFGVGGGAFVAIPPTSGDNKSAVVDVSHHGVTHMTEALNGSGALDNIKLLLECGTIGPIANGDQI